MQTQHVLSANNTEITREKSISQTKITKVIITVAFIRETQSIYKEKAQ